MILNLTLTLTIYLRLLPKPEDLPFQYSFKTQIAPHILLSPPAWSGAQQLCCELWRVAVLQLQPPKTGV